jgi:ATP-dependent Clp protease protease subunit
MTTTALQSGAQRIHLLVQSVGGSIQDGVCLFNYFRALPIELVAYNVGSVSSAATIAYLGAHRRKVSAFGTFMIHRAHANLQGANADMVQARIPSLIMDDERTEAILRDCIQLSPEQWAVHQSSDLWLSAKEAVAAGLAHELGEFAPPKGTTIFNVFG